MKIYIETTNSDADWYNKTSDISESELKIIKPLIKAILSSKRQMNYRTGLYANSSKQLPENMYPQFSKETHKLFSKFIDTGEYGVDTITNINVYNPIKI